ncbi:hypothetical protein CERSUDRAFT_71465 [Gelatoporia subvermispora B]|uniref:F-box domain-containing protein n=1 Tax=Ceriporiopsis subvermispora (strain B) TaxID=914234 RepID=M2PSD5_CERS8|nr:hypothetical protein CERSUDRAFT_71465 [Gelatoporia subvermispora B]
MVGSRNLFTLGIELEFAMQGNEAVYEEIVAWLNSQNIPVTTVLNPETELPKIYDKWVIKKDESITAAQDNRIPQPRIGVELVSPILVDVADQPPTRKEWKEFIERVLTVLLERYTLYVNRSTGFHVHIGVGAKELKLGGRFTLSDLKKIATVVYIFEYIIDKLHAQHRSGVSNPGTNYIKSIRENGNFFQFPDTSAIAKIWSQSTFEALMALMNPPHTGVPDGERRRRYYKVNFMSHWSKGTVEFRQHEGTVQHDVICAWVQFVLSLVRNTINMTETKVKQLQPTEDDLESLVGRVEFQAMQREPFRPRQRKMVGEAFYVSTNWVYGTQHPVLSVRTVGTDTPRRRPTPPKLRLNVDVLHCIFLELAPQDLYTVALVSRQWARVAQSPLYSSISLITYHDNAPLLARTMTTCPHLRPLVHSLAVTFGINAGDTALLEWLHLLPDNTIRIFRVSQLERNDDFASFILRSPFFRSVRLFHTRGFFVYTEKHLGNCFFLRSVKALHLSIPDSVNDFQVPSVPPTLTCLSITFYNYRPFMSQLVAAIGRQLEHLDLDTGNSVPEGHHIDELLSALGNHAHGLRSLTIRGLALPEEPYLNSIGRIVPSLEYLHLGILTFGPTLFDHLPPTLRTLRLEDDYRLDFPLDELEHFALKAGRGEIFATSLTTQTSLQLVNNVVWTSSCWTRRVLRRCGTMVTRRNISLSFPSHSLPICINSLLRAVGPHLERLEIDTGVDSSSMGRFPELFTTMAKSLSQLRQLTLRSRYCLERPFMDDIPHLMPLLESLHLGYGMFGSALWSHLSIHLRVLRLEHVSTVDFPFDEMENMFKRVGRGEIGLQSLTVCAKGLHCDPAPFVRIGEAHQDCGVDFTVMIYDPSVLQWMDGESHYENGMGAFLFVARNHGELVLVIHNCEGWIPLSVTGALLSIAYTATLLARALRDWVSRMQRSLLLGNVIVADCPSRWSAPPKPRLICDVLYYTLLDLEPNDLRTVALVSRQWAQAVRLPLYSSLSLKTYRDNAPLLARTMSTCPHLRPLVQFLTVAIGIDTQDTALFEWLHLLPNNTVRVFRVSQLQRNEDLATFILQSPFFRSVTLFEGAGFFLRTGKHLEDSFSLRSVKALHLFIPDYLNDFQPSSVPPKLTHLSITFFNYHPFISRLIAVVGHQLEHLDLDTGGNYPEGHQVDELLNALKNHVHALRHLTIRGLAFPEAPYLDSIGHVVPTVEYLHLGILTFGPALFDHLPSTLRTLRLEDDYRLDFPFGELEQFALKVGRGESQCRSITVIMPSQYRHKWSVPWMQGERRAICASGQEQTDGRAGSEQWVACGGRSLAGDRAEQG